MTTTTLQHVPTTASPTLSPPSSPSLSANTSHARLYTPDGLRQISRHLHPGGVFALWSNDPPDDDFLASLQREFAGARAQVVSFPNFLIDGDSHSTIYIATTPTA